MAFCFGDFCFSNIVIQNLFVNKSQALAVYLIKIDTFFDIEVETNMVTPKTCCIFLALHSWINKILKYIASEARVIDLNISA